MDDDVRGINSSKPCWVGISAQEAGIDGSGLNIGSTSAHFDLKSANPVRYGSLVHPRDRFSFDIFSQEAQAVLHPGDIHPLGGLRMLRAIAAGEAQSAFRMTELRMNNGAPSPSSKDWIYRLNGGSPYASIQSRA